MSTLRRWLEAQRAATLDGLEEYERKRMTKLPHWRTRRRRRAVAGVSAFGIGCMIVAALTLSKDTAWGFLLLWFGGAVVWFPALMLLRTLTGKMSTAFSSLLDEWERQWRHRINQVAYRVSLGLLLISFCYSALISGQEEAGIRSTMFVGAMLIVASSVTTLALAWLLPDDHPEDHNEHTETTETSEPHDADKGNHV